MQKEWIYRQIAKIGGLQLPGENLKGYLARVSEASGVHYDCVHAAYYGRYVSKNHREQFEQAAKNATHTKPVLAFAEYYLSIWEDHPEVHGEEIDAAREFIDRIRECDDRRRRYDEARARQDLSARRQNGGGEE